MSYSPEVDNRRGALLLVVAAAIFTADVTVLRYLSADVPFAQVIFFRSVCQLVIVAVWIAARKPALFRSSRWPRLILRGLTSLLCWWLYYASFQRLDLSLATTLTFTTSLFTVAMAPLILGERIGPLRTVATALGFVGVVLASGATGFAMDGGVLLGLGSAVAAAALIFQNRVLARTEHTATIMVWIGLVATLGTLPAAAAGWTEIAGRDLLLMTAAGTLATLGMLLTVEAYRFGEVSALATFPYVRLIFALGAGYVLFGEVASAREVLGAAVIVVCGILATERRRPPTPRVS